MISLGQIEISNKDDIPSVTKKIYTLSQSLYYGSFTTSLIASYIGECIQKINDQKNIFLFKIGFIQSINQSQLVFLFTFTGKWHIDTIPGLHTVFDSVQITFQGLELKKNLPNKDWIIDELFIKKTIQLIEMKTNEELFDDIKIAFKNLEKANIEADKANKAKSQFLANMSHEIRTPMNAILGYTQILQRDDSLNKNQLASIQSINKSGEHLLGLINDVLDMSRIEAGKVRLLPSSFSIFNFLQDIEEMFRFRIANKKLLFNIEIQPELPEYIYGDENRIRQVVINLLGNAVKFTNKGSISLYAGFYDNKIILSVVDTGIGIPSDKLDFIFGAFEQTDSGVKSTGGSGLGLAISKELSKLMGGNITVESEKDQGSKFNFTFNYSKGEKDQIKGKIPNKRILRLANNEEEIRILIVDDKFENRDILNKILEPLNFKTKEAENGLQAIDYCKQWHPHIVLLDIVMPVMDGKEAIKIIKHKDSGIDTLIIAISASVLDNEREEILNLGADSFINKPFKEIELLDQIRHHANIEYEYENNVELSKSHKESIDFNIEIQTLSSKIRTKLSNAAIDGDLDKLKKTISKEIEMTNVALTSYLLQLIEDFNLTKIQELFKDQS